MSLPNAEASKIGTGLRGEACLERRWCHIKSRASSETRVRPGIRHLPWDPSSQWNFRPVPYRARLINGPLGSLNNQAAPQGTICN